jgi:hypothetical protein
MRANGTVIPVGGTTDETFYLVSATVSDPDLMQVRLQVEVRKVGTTFVLAALASSAYVSSGSTVSVLVSLPPPSTTAPGDYHWHARTNDINNASSDWVSFGGNTEADIDFACAPGTGTIPDVPTSPAQLTSDGVTSIATGGTTSESRVIFSAVVTDPDAGNPVRLQIERRDINTAFSAVTHSAPFFVASGSASTIEVTGIANNSYYWRYRSQDTQGNVSAWTSFGGNLDNAPPGTPADVDFIVNTAGNTVPNAPAGLNQFTTADVIIASGAEAGTTVRFRATLSDAQLDGVRLQVEVRPLSTAFSNILSGESALVASGSAASVDVGNLPPGSYHWQSRVVDGSGSATAWTPFGGSPDFTVPAPPAPSSSKSKRCGLLGLEAALIAAFLLVSARARLQGRRPGGPA